MPTKDHAETQPYSIASNQFLTRGCAAEFVPRSNDRCIQTRTDLWSIAMKLNNGGSPHTVLYSDTPFQVGGACDLLKTTDRRRHNARARGFFLIRVPLNSRVSPGNTPPIPFSLRLPPALAPSSIQSGVRDSYHFELPGRLHRRHKVR